ncbi:MAG: prolyl oligopeptidase family serine peptidase [Bacteroidales bacterium]|nr:prolyl oligopeptidase family serine peptidase [Bacteroidales bacterium]
MSKKLIALILFACTLAVEAAVPMRSAAISELSPYCAPANLPAGCDATFMPDGTSYVRRSEDGRKLVLVDIATGKETATLFDVDHTRETTLPDFERFILSPDASKVLVARESEMVYRRSSTAKWYVYEVRSRLLKPLSKQFDRTMVPSFSPDSRMVAFVAENNVYVAKLDYETEVAATTDGAYGNIINGATDWSYEEEFDITSTLAWAPDNLTLCYIKFNESQVPLYNLPLYEGTCNPMEQYAQYPGMLSYKYPVAGATNSTVSVHSYDIETRKTKQVELPAGAGYYIPRILYGPSETQLLVATLNRDQNHFELFVANPKSTVTKSVYVEDSKAWIEPEVYEDLTPEADGFVLPSSADGFTRYAKYSYTGARMGVITPEGVDATAYYGSDATGNRYYQLAAPTPMDRTIERIDRKGVRSTISAKNGTSNARFAPGCKNMIVTFSDINTPPVITLCTSAGKSIRTLQDNKAYASRTSALLQNKEFFTFTTSEGVELNGYMVKPRNFSTGQTYPVIMSQYSGPGSQQVLNRWSLDWEMYYASKGYIIICVDGRGTAGRGTAFRTCVYKQLGHYETIDQVAAANYAASLPYVDGSRIGIYGWSYGGYQTLMCASADGAPYAAAVAVAPVTDWRYYDTIYTERYMLTPQQNERGYNDSSAILRALHLGCPLLIMYGTADDNVHPANSLQYVSTLQSAGMWCDMFVFPNMNHSINGCNARAVVYGRMFDFFESKLTR